MAKKGNRTIVGFTCSVCNSFNYITEKNKVNTTDKLLLKKYCRKCKKKTDHKETQKFK